MTWRTTLLNNLAMLLQEFLDRRGASVVLSHHHAKVDEPIAQLLGKCPSVFAHLSLSLAPPSSSFAARCQSLYCGVQPLVSKTAGSGKHHMEQYMSSGPNGVPFFRTMLFEISNFSADIGGYFKRLPQGRIHCFSYGILRNPRRFRQSSPVWSLPGHLLPVV